MARTSNISSQRETLALLEELLDSSIWDWPANAEDSIESALRQEDPEVRLLGAILAGRVLDGDLADALMELILDSDDTELRITCLQTFGMLLDEAAWLTQGRIDELSFDVSLEDLRRVRRFLRRIYHDASFPDEIRREALEVSAHAPEPWHAGAARAAYLTNDDEWKVTAIAAIAILPDAESEPIVDALLSDDPALLIVAAHAAGTRNLRSCEPRLLSLLHDENHTDHVRIAAADALHLLRSKTLRPALTELKERVSGDLKEAFEEIQEIEEFCATHEPSNDVREFRIVPLTDASVLGPPTTEDADE